MKILYEAKATAVGGRDGHVKTSNGSLDLALAIPKEMGGPGGALPNPEQLFAAGYAACFENALIYVARQRKVRPTGTHVDATVGIGPREDGGFGLTVRLEVEIQGVPREQAQALVDAADATCPYSNAIRGNVPVTVSLI